MLERATQQRTSIACPTQWEGVTTDGQHWYFRFRSGWVSLGFGPTEDDAVSASRNNRLQIGDDHDSAMTDEQYDRWWSRLAQRWQQLT